jgi:hypothetical protein
MTTTVRATLDRIVDGEHAVLLVEGEQGVDDEIVLDVDDLPENGQTEGGIFELEFEGETLQEMTYLPEETDERREQAQDRLDRLSSRFSNGTNSDNAPSEHE